MARQQPAINDAHTYPLIVFIDSHCPVCTWLARWVQRWDRAQRVQVHSIYEPLLQKVLPGIDPYRLNTMIVYDGRQVYTYGRAVLRLARALHLPWYWQWVPFVPVGLLDVAYGLVAYLRPRLARRHACMIPVNRRANQ